MFSFNICVAIKIAGFLLKRCLASILSTESVEGAALSFQGIDHIHSGDCLPLGVLSVCDGITDHILQEDLEDSTCLLIDQARDTFDTTSASQTTDSWLGDTLDVITQDLSVTLGASLSKSFSSFATSRHFD
jgi:hypothetical protein